MQSRWGRRATLVLGAVFLAFGVAESVTHWHDTLAARGFWAGSLLGGAVLVLGGALTWARHPRTSAALVVVGTLAGLLATAWTIAIPLLGITVIALAVRDVGPPVERTPGT
jgi:hypothetical protein